MQQTVIVTIKIFRKFINPGLEFYEGVQFAIDSLNQRKSTLEVFVYDTRSVQRNLLLEQINEIGQLLV